MICVKAYAAPPFRIKEALRYAGVRGELPLLESLLLECMDEAEKKLCYKACYGEFPLSARGDLLDLGFARFRSRDLAKCLKDCTRVVVFAATVGLELDRMIAKYANTSPIKALLLDAIGAERIEALCDLVYAEMAGKSHVLTPRFSPGYGDLSLEAQRDIFRVLDCPRYIGLTLNGSLLMTPSKSVTAIVGIKGT